MPMTYLNFPDKGNSHKNKTGNSGIFSQIGGGSSQHCYLKTYQKRLKFFSSLSLTFDGFDYDFKKQRLSWLRNRAGVEWHQKCGWDVQ